MKIFITGANGLLGDKVAQIALEKGHEVYSGYYGQKPEFGLAVELNLCEPATIRKASQDIKPEVIIHAAALTDIDKCELERELAFKTNVDGTRIIAEVARTMRSFLIYISTDYVFDGSKGIYKEDDSPNPINYYGFTKLLGEKYCQDFCIVRTSVIYGAKPAAGKVNFALWVLHQLRNGERVKIVADQWVTPTLNTSLAKMLLEIAERKLTGVFHLAGTTRVSRLEFSHEIARSFGLEEDLIIPSKMNDINWVARRPIDSSLDTSKSFQILKEKPYELKKALEVLKKEIEMRK